jgi:hypothetical protein
LCDHSFFRIVSSLPLFAGGFLMFGAIFCI